MDKMELMMNKFNVENEKFKYLKEYKNQKLHCDNLEESVDRIINKQIGEYVNILQMASIKKHDDIFLTMRRYTDVSKDIKESIEELDKIVPNLSNDSVVEIYSVDVKYLVHRQMLIIISEILQYKEIKLPNYNLILDQYSEIKKLYNTYKVALEILDVCDEQLKNIDKMLLNFEDPSHDKRSKLLKSRKDTDLKL